MPVIDGTGPVHEQCAAHPTERPIGALQNKTDRASDRRDWITEHVEELELSTKQLASQEAAEAVTGRTDCALARPVC